jgi:hypothetical protein
LHTHYHCPNYEDSVEFHSITISKREMDLKLYTLGCKWNTMNQHDCSRKW